MKYRKKPVVIDAMHWDGTVEGATPIIDWVLDGGGTARWHEAVPPQMHDEHCRCDGRGNYPGNGLRSELIPCEETEPQGPGVPTHIAIDTLEGTMRASAGDWIIRGVEGEHYPCKPSIFEQTFEPVEEG